MMKNKRAVRVPFSAKQQLETTQLRFWWQLEQTAATPFNFMFYFNGAPLSPVEVYFTNISHLKINIIIASSSHSLLSTEHSSNGLVEAPWN